MEEMEAPNMRGPLSGVRVLDLSINVLGPLTCQLLGDMGADVVKIEPPAGDPQRTFGPARNRGMSAFYLNLNRNKRSIILNLKRPAALEGLMRLVEGADVFVHSMRLSAAKRLGIGYDAVFARNPRIIYAAGTGYSQKGPRRDRPAYDDVIQGESGIADMNRRTTGDPSYIPMPFADKFCGYVQASSIAMALYAREKTGHGQAIYTPMLETMVGFNMIEHLWGSTFDPPVGGIGYPRMFTPHRRPFATMDGYVCLLPHTDEQWRSVFMALERPELSADERFASIASRTTNVAALYEVLAQELKGRSTAGWLARFAKVDVPASPVAALDELSEDSYLSSVGCFRRVAHPTEGNILSLGIPSEFSMTPGDARRHAPALGEHTFEILRDIGLSDDEIIQLGQ